MPIVKDGNGVAIEYHIPQDVKAKIPDYFYFAFAGELFSVFGLEAFQKDECGLCRIEYCSGTAGWSAAFKMTCKKLDIMWLWEYWNSLEWYDSDLFDGEIESAMLKHIEKDENNTNAYYLHLIKV